MLNLKLFTALQGGSSASLLLKPSAPGQLQYFIMSASVNYNIVVSGICDGELPGATPLSFDVVLSSITPLLDKNYKFRITYANNVLQFVEEQERFVVEPLCVEHISDFALEVAQKFLDTTQALVEDEESKETRKKLEDEVKYLKSNYEQLKILEMSGPPSDNPWSDPVEAGRTSLDQKYLPKIEEAEARLEKFDDESPIHEVSFNALKRIASVAARYNTTVSLCEDYALVDLKTCYILQKCPCGSRAIQGKLLQRLLQEDNGRFFEYNGDLVFTTVAGKDRERSSTMLFLQSYLPNVSVDSSIITKGSVLEKYSLNLKGMLTAVTAVLSKFETMTFKMGDAELVLSNDRGEKLVHNFDMKDAQTIALNKAMRGESVDSRDLEMSTIEVPRAVQRILGMLREDFTVYVKSRKIVIQSGDIYVVFAR